MKKEIVITFFVICFVISISSAQITRFVKVGGTGDGSTWQTAAPDFITAALEPTAESNIYIYVAQGDYGDINFDRDGGDAGNESNLPDDKNVFIYGGFSPDLEGTSRCGYDPGKYIVSVTPDGSANGGESVFRMDDTDGNLTVKGMQFINPQNDNIKFGSVLTVDDRVNGTIIFEDIYMTGHDADPGDGAFHFRDGASGNVFTLNNLLAEGNINTTLSAQTSTTNNTFNINNSFFFDNHDSSGGAILIRSNSDNPNLLVIDSCYFCNNRSTQISSGGGAISIQNKTKAEISNSYFFDNSASNNGGAINVIGESELVSKSNYYKGNTADFGGAISISSGKIHSMMSDVFYLNEAQTHGGAIRINGESSDNPYIIIEDATFYQNMSGRLGGGIMMTGGITEYTPQIKKSKFCQNTSPRGGAVALDGNNTLDSDDNIFIQNTATREGGAIYILGASTRVPPPAHIIRNDYFEGNTASNRGGGLYAEALANGRIGNIEIYNSNFKNNSAGNGSSNGEGAAIMLNGPGVPKASCKVQECNFEMNKANLGGAIYSRLSNSIYILNSSFWDNEAWESGGAIFNAGGNNAGTWTSSDGISRSFMVEGCLFHSNLAGTGFNGGDGFGGGGIFDLETVDDRVYIYNTNFYSNKAFIGDLGSVRRNRRGGGAVRSNENTLFRNVIFNNNYVNNNINFREEDGGSDVQDRANDVNRFENCKMQMEESQYNDTGWIFLMTTFNENAVPVPSKPTSIMSKICEAPEQKYCSSGINIFDPNLETKVNLSPDCTENQSKIAVNLEELKVEDFPIMYTWIPPVAPPTSGTANQISDLELQDFTKIGEYTLQIMDNQGCKDTASIIMNTVSCAALPVQLFDFRLEHVDSDITLTWKTASEINNSHFDVERSSNAINWSKLGEVAAHGTTTVENSYRYVDQELEGVYNILYYRLKQIDFNDNYTYSEILSIDLVEHLEGIRIYPNPAKDLIHISGLQMEHYTIELRNSKGEKLKVSQQSNLDLSEYQTGIYLIVILNADNQVIKTEKIMIAK